MTYHPEPRSKKEKRILHLVLGALGANQDERRLAFLAYQYRGYADALRYLEELYAMVDLEVAQKWLPRFDNGLEPVWVVPCRFDAAGNALAYRCQKCDGGGSVTIEREALEAYYERDGVEPEEATA
jgi:hypothetical protein